MCVFQADTSLKVRDIVWGTLGEVTEDVPKIWELFSATSLGRQTGRSKVYEHLYKLAVVKSFRGAEPPWQREKAGNTKHIAGRGYSAVCSPQSGGDKILTNKIRIKSAHKYLQKIINICIVPYTLQRAFTETISINSSNKRLKTRSLKLEHSHKDVLGKPPGEGELKTGFFKLLLVYFFSG